MPDFSSAQGFTQVKVPRKIMWLLRKMIL